MLYSDDGRWFYFEMSPIGGNGIRDMKWNDLEGIFSEWMQFTWLLDKNWNEIYFWDILATSNSKEPYDTWDKEEFWFTIVQEEENYLGIKYSKWWVSDYADSCYNNQFIEVIWNIYENPELLKK